MNWPGHPLSPGYPKRWGGGGNDEVLHDLSCLGQRAAGPPPSSLGAQDPRGDGRRASLPKDPSELQPREQSAGFSLCMNLPLPAKPKVARAAGAHKR